MARTHHDNRPRLRLQAATLFAGNLAFAVSQAGTLVILSKLTSPAAVGQLGLGVAISAPLLVLAGFQLRSIQAAGLSSNSRFGDFLGFRLWCLAAVMTVTLGIAAFGSYSTDTARVLVGVGLWKCVDSLSEVAYGYAQNQEMVGRISTSLITKAVASLAVVPAVIVLTRSVLWVALALAMVSALTFLFYDRRTIRLVAASRGDVELSPRVRSVEVAEIVRLGLPLGVTSLLGVLAYNIPRYFLQHLRGEQAVGYFSAIGFPFAAFSVLMGALGQAATPRMAASFSKEPREFWRSVGTLCGVSVLVCVAAIAICMVWGPSVLTVLFTRDYATYFSSFMVLLAAAGCWSLASALGYAATCSGRIYGQVPASAATCVSALILSPLLIPDRGVLGAALVYLVGGAVNTLAFAVLILRSIQVTRMNSSALESALPSEGSV